MYIIYDHLLDLKFKELFFVTHLLDVKVLNKRESSSYDEIIACILFVEIDN